MSDPTGENADIGNNYPDVSDTITFKNRKSGYHIILKKTGVDSASQEVIAEHLGGATFTIYNDRNRTTIATGLVEEDGKEVPRQLKDLTSADTDGIFFDGLMSAGTYYLHETEAPTGYYKPANDLRMMISDDGKVSIFGQNGGETEEITAHEGVRTVVIRNYSGYALPSTGGPGTRLFTIFGILLLALSSAGAMMRKRREELA